MIYQFLRRLVTPFNKWDAYETGVIDADGKVIVDKQDRTPEQKRSWGYFDKLTANLKKLLGKIPGGKTRLASFAAALLLLREENIDPDDLDFLEERLVFYMDHATELMEEGEGGAPTNSVGSGKIAGAGVGPQGEPGVKKKRKKELIIKDVLRRVEL